MKVLFDGDRFQREDMAVCLQKKMDADERIVRERLVKVWTKILEKYARPGAHIPPIDVLWEELLEKGVNAAVSAVVDEHWFVFSFMIRDEMQKKVEKGLERFDLSGFIEEVRAAQNDPGLLGDLRERIRHDVLFV